MTKPRRIFVCAHADLFHENIPDEWIDRIFAVMALCPQHTFQVLTKRPERMRDYLMSRNGMGNSSICSAINNIPANLGNRHGALELPLPNAWFGVSVENQEAADERIPLLLQTPAAVRWVSCEPLLGAVDLTKYLRRLWSHCNCDIPLLDGDEHYDVNSTPLCPKCQVRLGGDPELYLHWVVIGGESGPNARPMNPGWAYSLRDQCKSAGVPFLFKQWGEWVGTGHPAFGSIAGEFRHIRSDGSFWSDDLPQDENSDVITIKRVGKKLAGRVLGGEVFDQYPERYIYGG